MKSRVASISVGLALIFTLRAGFADAPPVAQSPAPGAGFDISNIDRSVSPGVDFYQFAVGGWRRLHPIPKEYPQWDASSELEEANRVKLRKILETAEADTAAAPGSNQRKLGDFYRSGMDESGINRAGVGPIGADLTAIDRMRTVADLEKVVARLHTYEIPVFFSFVPDQDARNSDMVIAEINQDGLGLPDRDYYVKTDSKSKALQAAYRKHVARMFELLGASPKQAMRQADRVYAFETALARKSRTNVALRDPVTNYHRMGLAGLVRLAPAFPWKAYLHDVGSPSRGFINVSQPEFVQALNDVWSLTPMEDLRLYLRWHLVNGTAAYLSDAFVHEDFAFNGRTLRGLEALKPRWKRVVQSIDDGMGEALGKAYADQYFTPEAKAQALAMVENLKDVLREDLKTLSWMSEPTRRRAIEKLNAMHEKIGYPDKWRDYSGLNIGPVPYATNVLRARQFDYAFNMHKIDRPVDRSLWDMTPPTVNAYYNPALNEIVFPAGILQPPFFDPKQDDAYNYGCTAATIGHEMTHGFDDQGALYDAKGNLHNWWTKDDMARFKQRTVAIQKLFDSYTLEDGLHENGKLESGEAIADLGGLKIAYRAFEKSLEGKPRLVDANGFTPEQRFFLGFAYSWACNDRPQYARLMALTNPHPLERFRVLGSVSNLPEFAQAFGLKDGDPMVLPTDKRTDIW